MLYKTFQQQLQCTKWQLYNFPTPIPMYQTTITLFKT